MGLEKIVGSREYRIVRLVADGGMGSVYQAQQLGNAGFSKTVAIKTILDLFAADEEFVRLFIGEAKLVADLVHENIVQVYDLGLSEGRYFIVMEYVEGITLEAFVRMHLDEEMPLPAELGAFIAQKSNFSEPIVVAIRHHHTPDDYEGPHQPMLDVVTVANYLASWQGISSLGVHNLTAPSDLVYSRLSMKKDRLEEIWSQLEPTLESATALAAL